MLHDLWEWMQVHFWIGMLCTRVGAAVIAAPFLSSRRFRRWFGRQDVELEHIGLVVLLIVLLCIGIPNFLRGTD